MGVVMITHYQRLLDEVTPDHIHILVDGRIVATGGMELAEQLERDGYDAFRPTVGAAAGGSTVTELSTMTLDVATIRKEFPILDREIDGAPIVYLDSGNTSQKPRQVIDAMSTFLEQSYAPINRSSYRLAGEATDAYEHGRQSVARFINAPQRRRGRVHQERHRVDQPRRPDLGSREPEAQATSSCSPRWSTTPTSCRGTCWRPSAASRSAGSPSPPTADSTRPTSAVSSTAPRCCRSRR